jgi:hypothetical protein
VAFSREKAGCTVLLLTAAVLVSPSRARRRATEDVPHAATTSDDAGSSV